jgi:hypothetical protein
MADNDVLELKKIMTSAYDPPMEIGEKDITRVTTPNMRT